jgi:hypothetical protein
MKTIAVLLEALHSGQSGGQKSLGPLKKTLEIADYVFCGALIVIVLN